VILHAELGKGTVPYLTDSAMFWVVKARVAAGEVSGLGTLLSGAYIGMEPGRGGEPCRQFVGLEVPPIVTRDLPGRHYTLNTDTLASMDIGTVVYYRKIEVGKVVSYQLRNDGKSIDLEIFIAAPHHQRVREDTRFWNASGLNVSMGADGIQVDTESLVSILMGGISFDVPEDREDGKQAPPGTEFKLYPNRESAFKQTFTEKSTYMICFDSSIRGLQEGAPVEFRGIKIGEVVDIRLEYLAATSDFRISVWIETEPERFEVIGQRVEDLEEEDVFKMYVERGMRAQLKVGSLITGQLFVDLDFHSNVRPAEIHYENGFFCIPSVPNPMEEITDSITQLLNNLEKLPLEEIGADVQKTVQRIEELVSSSEIIDAIKALDATLQETTVLTDNVNREITPRIVETLDRFNQALASIESMTGEDSALQMELKQALADLAGAARSIRTLTDYLERHPESLLKGKPNE
jgi:paraquat-inducible protein B